MRIVVDWDLCEANALCMASCPEVFEVDDQDQMHVHEDKITADLRESLEDAVRLCPRQALTLEDDD